MVLYDRNKELRQPQEKYIYVVFNTIDWSIECYAPCYISENFTKVEEKLYNEYPELKNKQIYFTVNGITINRSDTLEKNNIKYHLTSQAILKKKANKYLPLATS